MQAVLERQTTIDISAIYAMRHSGATLGQIAERIGRTKERIRQILIKDYGSTRHRLVSTRQLCKLAGLAPYRLAKLCRDSIISPVREWDTNNGHYCLWSPATVEKIKSTPSFLMQSGSAESVIVLSSETGIGTVRSNAIKKATNINTGVLKPKRDIG